jgi:hypothetical protein
LRGGGKLSDLTNTITRTEAATLLGINAGSLRHMEKKGLIPTPAVSILNAKTGHINIGYDRAIFMAWVKTHSEEGCFHGDVWNIRKNRKNFEYKGMAKNIILFCQPKLLNRGLTFD